MLRQAVLDAGESTEALPADSGICSTILRAYCKASGDLDDVLATWIDQGAPIGMLRKVGQRGTCLASNNGLMFDYWDELREAVGSIDIVLNTFGRITKARFDCTVKYWII